MQIDLKGWFLNYSLSFQYHSLLQILNCVAGIENTVIFIPTTMDSSILGWKQNLSLSI